MHTSVYYEYLVLQIPCKYDITFSGGASLQRVSAADPLIIDKKILFIDKK